MSDRLKDSKRKTKSSRQQKEEKRERKKLKQNTRNNGFCRRNHQYETKPISSK
jgi:hypothetical protein